MDTDTNYFSTSLPHLGDITVDLLSLAFPESWTRFHVPILKDKPQNPIMDTLQTLDHQLLHPVDTTSHYGENKVPRISEQSDPDSVDNDLWTMIKEEATSPNTLMSWDTLGSSIPQKSISSCFLSEQTSSKYSAVRYHLLPLLQDASVQVRHVTASELQGFLFSVLTGISSALWVWDSPSQSFILGGCSPNRKCSIIVDGKDDAVSDSVLSRFLRIGSSIRRLETCVDRLRNKRGDPVFHAFAHAVSSVLSYLVSSVTKSVIDDHDSPLIALWATFSSHEDALVELSECCQVDINLHPSEFRPSPSSAVSLLSSVYDRLQARIEESSPKIIVALMAFILTVSSQPYLNRICECVGMRSSQSSGNPRRTPGYQFRVLQDGIEVPNLEDEASDDDDEDDSHPSFLSPSLVQGLMRARRSLKLLRAAQPEHALVRSTPDEAILRWIWTESDITEVFETGALKASPSSVHEEEPPRITPYGVDFPEFQLFDCEPGSQVASDVIVSESSQPSQFELFLAPFPDSLPSLTPTLPALADLVLSPLVQRLSSISTALVDVFLSPDTHLHLYSNLVLLRSYLLLTSPSFKSRLQAALFSDADECLTPLPPTKSQKSSGKATSHSAPSRHAPSPINRWAVGLSRKLMEGGWPPGGANLSFSLRTVIIDSLENDNYHKFRKAREAPEEFDHERLRILREAEWRLGFAIRDLPIGSEARWLNPRSTEALDFLYMEYQPPHPLDVLIHPEVLSKYHRVFAFNLRLLRVENAIHALFRMARDVQNPLFPTLSPSRKLFLRFHFIAQNFVEAVSSYIYDIAIGSNFDAFLSTVSPSRTSSKGSAPVFSDIFTLAEQHSALLDVILGACLLRSSQRAEGELLRGSLDMILELALLMADLKQGTYQEYQASTLLEKLFKLFRSRMTKLTKRIAELVERGISIPATKEASSTASPGPESDISDMLSDLLVRLDMSNFWRNVQKSST